MLKHTCTIVSLGCAKNLVDSEQMLGQLEKAGYPITHDVDNADVIIINTCGFLASSRQESYDVIDEMLTRKRNGQVKRVVVAGCLVQADKDVVSETCKDVDIILDVFSRDAVLEALNRLEADPKNAAQIQLPLYYENYQPGILPHDLTRHALTPPHVAFMKIAEGCNRTCSFCLIPQIRGGYISKPIEECVSEARRLADSGVRELVLLAQDTSFYGTDLYQKPQLAQLLQQLDKIENLNWIRLMYLYPLAVDDYLIDTIANAEKVLPYVDMPLQHIDNDVLKAMNRGVSGDRVRALLDKMRAKIDNLVLRTTLISGFPGETKSAHKSLVKFLKQQRFNHVGVFEFSPELGTQAAKLPGQVNEEEIHARAEELMDVQADINIELNEEFIENEFECVLDCELEESPGSYIGRTWMDAPDVDGVIYVTIPEEMQDEIKTKELKEGQFLPVRVIAQEEYDLVGIPAE